MKRIITLVFLAIMAVNIVACDRSFREDVKNLPATESTVDSMQEGSGSGKTAASFSQNSKYSLDKIKLSVTERSWVCPDEKYKALLKSYDGNTVTGAIVVATDKDIVYLYAEDALEKDGKTKVSQDTVFDLASVSKVFTAVAILQS